MKRAAFLASGILCASLLSAITADDVVRKTGIAGGFCALPLAAKGDAALACGLAARPSFVVHAQSADAAVIQALRSSPEAAGLLGRSLYVEEGKPAPLPYADRLVDLLVADALRDADLTPEFRAACLRVLGPGRATALLGRAKEAGGGLSKSALKEWVKDLPRAKILDDDSGLWVLLRLDLPPGSDAWSHRLHGPENSQVSADATFQAPFLVQWWGLPRKEGFWGTTVVACNGRMFTVRGSRNTFDQVSLTARSLNNGVVLWQRDLNRLGADGKRIKHGGYIPGRSCIVAAPDFLYLADSNGVLRLDAETGTVRDRIAGPTAGGQVKWFALSGKLLAMMVGSNDVITSLSYQTVADNPVGRELAVYDTEQNKLLWHDTVGGDIDERMIVARDQQLYCLVQGTGLTSRDLRDGKTLWVNADTNLQAEYKTPDSKAIRELLVSLPVLSALQDVLILRATWTKNTIALSRADGELLWRKPTAGGSYRGRTACAAGDLWLGGPQPVNLRTGAVTNGPKFITSGCGPSFTTRDYLITCFGSVMDLHSGKVLRPADIKSPCDVGTLVSDGIMVTMPSECQCYFEMKGYRALASAGSIKPHTAPTWSDRLTVFDTKAPAPLKATDADWPQYRHDAQRSGASAATVSPATNVLWHWKPAGAQPYTNPAAFALGQNVKPDFLSTAPVAVDGRVWFGAPDGSVRCLQADTGKELWSFPTGSMLFKPPTLWEGRLLVGGGDGRIYCLDATTGKCLWQLQLAPVDRRVFWLGHLVSTWPILTGVAVHDGVGYAVAGYQKDSGLHACAFDPKDGRMLWENNTAGTLFSSGGGLAVGGGKVWLPAGCFDVKTGDAAGGSSQAGGEVAVFDRWVIRGGRRITEAEETFGSPLTGSGFGMIGMGPKTPSVEVSATGTALPAWDGQHLLLPSRGSVNGPLTLVPSPAFMDWATNYPAAREAYSKAPKEAKPKLSEIADIKTWATEQCSPVAFALAKNQSVTAGIEGKKFRVSGYAREDGKKLWSAELPEQPAMNRLAVDRDGRAIVSLCDGSVICLGR
jgi:outer membrane protein assembly factor BamB